MAEDNVHNLTLDLLRKVDRKIDFLTTAVHELNREMHAMRHHVRANELDIEANRNLVASLTTRVDRIERRLELSDGPSTPSGFAEELPPYSAPPTRRE
jgi:outer membrane murein-binding lipoprotein Lpp